MIDSQEEILKKRIINKINELGKDLINNAHTLVLSEWEIFQRDYDSSVKSFAEKEVPNEDGDRTYAQDNYFSDSLDGRMDLGAMMIVNLVCNAVTELAIEENGFNLSLPKDIDFLFANRKRLNVADLFKAPLPPETEEELTLL